MSVQVLQLVSGESRLKCRCWDKRIRILTIWVPAPEWKAGESTHIFLLSWKSKWSLRTWNEGIHFKEEELRLEKRTLPQDKFKNLFP